MRAGSDGEGDPLRDIARRLLDRAERTAERQVALVRLGVGTLLLLLVGAVALVAPAGEPRVLRQLAAGAATCLCLLAVGALALVALRRGASVRRLAVLTSTADFLAILGNVAFDLLGSGAPGA